MKNVISFIISSVLGIFLVIRFTFHVTKYNVTGINLILELVITIIAVLGIHFIFKFYNKKLN